MLGMEPNDQVRPAPRPVRAPPVPPILPETAIRQALEASKELRSLESKLLAKGLDVRSERANRLPKLDLVAQYGLLARFNNYEEFFNSFQRHNGQLGVSFQIPLFNRTGRGRGGIARRDRSGPDSYTDPDRARAYRRRHPPGLRGNAPRRSRPDVARLDLEVWRASRSPSSSPRCRKDALRCARSRTSRGVETDKWIALYDAAANLDKARLALLRQTGTLVAALAIERARDTPERILYAPSVPDSNSPDFSDGLRRTVALW